MTNVMKRVLLLLLLGLGVASGARRGRRGLSDALDDLGRMGGGGMSGGPMARGEGMMHDDSFDDPQPTGPIPGPPSPAPTPETPAPTPDPTPDPTRAPTPDPTPFPTSARDPINSETAELVRQTFIPGGSVHTLESTEETTFFDDTFVFSGQLTATEGGIVSLSALADKIPFVTCDLPNRAIQVDFNVSIGTGQLPHMFPEGSVLVVNSLIFGACDMSPPAIPEGINLGQEVVADAYLVIEYLIVNNDFTITLHGKSGNFFNMFSEGSLSIAKTSSVRRSLKTSQFEDVEGIRGQDLSSSGHDQNRRELAFSETSSFDAGLASVSGTITIDDEGGLQTCEATWGADGLSMMAEVRMEFIAIIDTDVTFEIGTATDGTFVQFPIASSVARFSPLVLTTFPTLNRFALPDYLLDTFSEAPMFVEISGTSKDKFGFGSRLRYSTGVKSYSLSANGPWDDIKTGATLIESTPGRFTSSAFNLLIRDSETPQDVGEFNDFRVFAGAKPALIIYGSLFSAHAGLKVGTDVLATEADPSFPPLDSAEGLFGDCESCPKTRVFGGARTTEPELYGTLGSFVDPDCVGPSDQNTVADLQFFVPGNGVDNLPVLLDRALVCLNPQFGQNKTESCGDVCCDGSVGGLGEVCMENQCVAGAVP